MNKISNKMFGKLIVLDKKEKLLNGEITIKREGYSQYNGNITIPLFEKDKTLNGSITVKREKAVCIPGTISVYPKNSLYGKIEIIDTPKRKFYGDTLKDSHTLNTYPTSNFGLNKNLEFTQDSTVFLGYSFDKNKDSLYLSDNEQEAYLELYITLAVQKNTKLKVFTTSNNWSEQFIVENNKPIVNDYITIDIPTNHVGWFKIPLGSLLKDINKVNSSFQQSLAIQAVGDNTSTYSKESLTDLHPRMYYEYYVTPPSTRKIVMSGEITVEKNSTKRLKGSITIDSKIVTKTIPGSIDIPVSNKEAFLGGSITILKQPIPRFFLGSLEIPIFDSQAILGGNITIKGIDQKVILGNLEIPVFNNQKALGGTIEVEQENKGLLKGLLEIPLFNNKKLLSGQINIKKINIMSFPGSVDIPLFEKQNFIDGQITVMKTDTAIISGFIEIPLLKETAVMSGEITVMKTDSAMISGFIEVPLSYIKRIMSGQITIEKTGIKMINGFIEVPLFEDKDVIGGTIFIDNKNIKTKTKQYSFIM